MMIIYFKRKKKQIPFKGRKRMYKNSWSSFFWYKYNEELVDFFVVVTLYLYEWMILVTIVDVIIIIIIPYHFIFNSFCLIQMTWLYTNTLMTVVLFQMWFFLTNVDFHFRKPLTSISSSSLLLSSSQFRIENYI